MARRRKGEGSYIHMVPQNCKTCPEAIECTKIGNIAVHCSKRDRRDRWIYQYTVHKADGSICRKSLVAKTRKELIEKVNRMQTEQTATGKQRTEATVEEWMDVWLNKILPGTVKPSTLAFYKYMLKYVTLDVRKKRISSVTTVMLTQMINHDVYEHGSRKGAPLSTTTVRSLRNTLIMCFNAAVEQDVITKNPVKKVKPLREQRQEKTILNLEQIKQLLAVADNGLYRSKNIEVNDGTKYLTEQWSLLIRVALVTGLRRGELFGMQWTNVFFSKKIIRVESNLQYGNIVEVKTHTSYRDIRVDEHTMQRLLAWQQRQNEYASGLGDLFTNDDNLVFTNIFGKPVDVNNFRRRVFTKMIEVAGLPKTVTLHSLRHTHATLLLEKGVDINTVSSRLGHSTANFTLNVYIHKTDATEESAAIVAGTLLGEDD